MAHHLFIVDLEATCDRSGMRRDQMEIIEIGGVLVDSRFAPVAEFQTFIRPVRNRKLSQFCTELTHITQAMVDPAPTFPEAHRRMLDFLAQHPKATFASWGRYDYSQLRQDCKHHDQPWGLGKGHINLKAEFGRRAGGAMGVQRALSRCRLRFEGTHHRGIDDARNIARLAPYALGRKQIPPTGGHNAKRRPG